MRANLEEDTRCLHSKELMGNDFEAFLCDTLSCFSRVKIEPSRRGGRKTEPPGVMRNRLISVACVKVHSRHGLKAIVRERARTNSNRNSQISIYIHIRRMDVDGRQSTMVHHPAARVHVRTG